MMDIYQASDNWVIPKKTGEKPSKKPAPNLIQFQFVTPVIIYISQQNSNDQ